MPKAKKKTVTQPTTDAQPVSVAPPVTTPVEVVAASADSSGGIHYDRVEMVEYSTTSAQGPLTVEDMKTLLWWETEKEYQERMVKEKPESKPEHWLFGDVYHCLDGSRRKVRCWNNANNRPFDDSWCEDLEHTILVGQWAGPLTFPGETVNGETVRISRYGKVLSGQHQMTAAIRANEKLQKSRAGANNAADPKYPFWNGREQVVLETIVVTGLSEDERVLRTIDYVKPRTTADMLYTMQLFRDNTPVERKEMTRMLASAIDTLWTRTDTKGYRTHPEVVGFLERHRRLLKCVEHLFVENSVKGADGGRKISKLKISAGQCSALCYLMGCGSNETTDYSDTYRNESPPSERGLDWSHWDQALEFWSRLAGDRAFIPVRMALGRLLDSSPGSDDNPGMGGRGPEKLAIIAKAWEHYKGCPKSAHGAPFSNDDLASEGVLSLAYSDIDEKGNKLPDGEVNLLDTADFRGIDCPEGLGSAKRNNAPPMPPPPTREEIERAKEEALKRREEQRDKLRSNRAAADRVRK